MDALLSAHNNCALNGLQMDLFVAAEDGDESSDVFGNGNSFPYDKKNILLRQHHCVIDVDGKIKSMKDLEGQQFDLTVANILAPALIYLAPKLR